MEKNVNDWISFLVEEIRKTVGKDRSSSDSCLCRCFSVPQACDVVVATCRLEYEARRQNKALLIRGMQFYNVGNDVLDSTIRDLLVEHDLKWGFDPNPVSVSYNNSLFCAGLGNLGSCTFLAILARRIGMGYDRGSGQDGYVLFIDKGQYVRNQCGGLFRISPLTTLAALHGDGEFFHSRAKAAMISRSEYGDKVIGVACREFCDPYGVLIIERDPFWHAALFSKFVANNHAIVYSSSLGDDAKRTIKYKHLRAARWYESLMHKRMDLLTNRKRNRRLRALRKRCR